MVIQSHGPTLFMSEFVVFEMIDKYAWKNIIFGLVLLIFLESGIQFSQSDKIYIFSL